jgi:aryl-phospho-beta-D-glucosidase BglC (GH1 family)
MTIQIFIKRAKRYLENGLFFMEVRKQKSGEERIKEQSISETVCFAWRNRFCSFQRHKNKPSLFCFFFGRCKKEKESNSI